MLFNVVQYFISLNLYCTELLKEDNSNNSSATMDIIYLLLLTCDTEVLWPLGISHSNEIPIFDDVVMM